jgi:hypothetical protein
MLLSEIKSTARSAFTHVTITRSETRGQALDQLAGDNDELLALIDKRRNIGVDPLTPEIANDLKPKLEAALNVKLFGKGFVNRNSIIFQADRERINQQNPHWWTTEEKIKHLAPRGYEISVMGFDPDEDWSD